MPIALPVCAVIFGIAWVIGEAVKQGLQMEDLREKEVDLKREEQKTRQLELKVQLAELEKERGIK
jgi:hypothetical protein